MKFNNTLLRFKKQRKNYCLNFIILHIQSIKILPPRQSAHQKSIIYSQTRRLRTYPTIKGIFYEGFFGIPLLAKLRFSPLKKGDFVT